MIRLASNVPKVSKTVAVFVVILNLIFPGAGTILAACCTDKYAISKT